MNGPLPFYNHFERARFLIQARHYPEAEGELRQTLALNPQYALAHSLLAICLSEQAAQKKKYDHPQSRRMLDEALNEARQGVHLAPEQSYPHYALAVAYTNDNRPHQAITAVNEALRLEPDYLPAHVLKAQVFARLGKWRQMLQVTAEGLCFDPQSVDLLSWRSVALYSVGQHQQAEQVILQALAQNPQSHLAYATQGWLSLTRNQPANAVEAFRQALRLKPDLAWAQIGYNRARLRASQNYRTLLGGCYGWVRLFAKEHAGPLSDYLELRPEDRAAAPYTAALLLGGLLAVLAGLLTGQASFFLLAFWLLAMTGPATSIYMVSAGRQRISLVIYTILLTLGGSVVAILPTLHACLILPFIAWAGFHALFYRFLSHPG